MGQFYASLESDHTTASTALKRLAGYTGKNRFYRANRELGRIFKMEHISRYMSDPLSRQQIRRGLLKSEKVHALPDRSLTENKGASRRVIYRP